MSIKMIKHPHHLFELGARVRTLTRPLLYPDIVILVSAAVEAHLLQIAYNIQANPQVLGGIEAREFLFYSTFAIMDAREKIA